LEHAGRDNKSEIKLPVNVNTSTIDENIYAFGDPAAPHIKNNGIERDGGITNLYRDDMTYTGAGNRFVADDGSLIELMDTSPSRLVRLDGKQIGSVNRNGVAAKVIASGYDDVTPTIHNTLLAIKLSGGAVQVDELDEMGAVINTRTTTFTNLSTLQNYYTSISIVRNGWKGFADNQNYLLRIGEAVIELDESAPTVTSFLPHTDAGIYGNAGVYTLLQTSPYLNGFICLTYNGLFSYDGFAWKYIDGSGIGTYPSYNIGAELPALSTAYGMLVDGSKIILITTEPGPVYKLYSYDGNAWNIKSTETNTWVKGTLTAAPFLAPGQGMVKYGNYYVIVGVAGLVAAWDIVNNVYRAAAAGGVYPVNNATVLGAVQINTVCTSGGILVFAGASGRVGSFDGAAWKNYDGTGAGAGPYNNNTAINAAIYASCYYAGELVIAGSSGKIASCAGTTWRNYDGTGGGGTIYNNGVVVGANAISNLISSIRGLAVINNAGKIGSLDTLGNWRNYDATGTGLWVYDNNTASSTGAIVGNACAYWPIGDVVIFGTGLGEIGSFNAGVNVSGISVITGYKLFTFPAVAKHSTWTSINSCEYSTASGNYFVISDQTGKVSSFDGTNWKYFDGTGTGTGPYDDGTNFGIIAALLMKQLGTWLVVAAKGTGKFSSYDGTAWKYTGGGGAGTGPSGNGTVIDNIQWLEIYKTALVFGGSTSRVGNITAAGLLTKYDGTGAGLQPFTTASVLGAAGVVSTMIEYKTTTNDFLVVAGLNGVLGSFNGTAWTTYLGAGGTGPWSNATAIGAVNIIRMIILQSAGISYLIIGGGAGGGSYYIASCNGTVWKNADGTGTGAGPYLTKVDASTTYPNFIVSNNTLIVISFNSTFYWVNGVWNTTIGQTEIGVVSSIPGAGYQPIQYGDLWLRPALGGLIYVYVGNRFYPPMYYGDIIDKNDSGSYLSAYNLDSNGWLGYSVILTGNYRSVGFYVNFSTKFMHPYRAQYQVVKYTLNAGRTQGKTLYTGKMSFGPDRAFFVSNGGAINTPVSTTILQFPTYQLFAQIVSSVDLEQAAPGMYDASIKYYNTTASIYGINVPQYKQAQAATWDLNQTQTDTLVNAYGKLTDAFGMGQAVGFSFRVGMVNGTQAFVSVAITGGTKDALGVLLSGVSEYESSFLPVVVSDDKIIWKYQDQFFYIRIGTDIDNAIQRIGEKIYKLNTISPLNIVSTETKALDVGSIDYNGRMLFTSTEAIAAPATLIAARIDGKYSNSIDVGDKIISITTPTSDNYEVIGFSLPDKITAGSSFGVDVYLADTYYKTTFNDGSELAVPQKVGTGYVEDSRVPIALPSFYSNKSAYTGVVSYLLDINYDGSFLANQIDGAWDVLSLFGQDYLFDQENIYLASYNGVLLSSTAFLASARGLVLIAQTPRAIYFYSQFDNSLYSFTGGRVLDKVARMNRLDAIVKGAYNTRDNTLVVETLTKLWFMRDDIATLNTKDALMTGIRFYDTSDGLIIGNDVNQWQYNYNAVGTVQPLDWQSAYFGQDAERKSIARAIHFLVYSPTKAKINLELMLYSYDEDDYKAETHRVTINPNQYQGSGYVRVRIKPTKQLALGYSTGIKCNQKVLVGDCFIAWDDGMDAIDSKARTV
jgi:hypothetical protein